MLESDSVNVKPKLTCRLCASKNLREVFRLPATPAANAFQPTRDQAIELPRYPLAVNTCICGHYQLSHVVNPALLFGNYAYTTGSSPALKAHFENLAAELVIEAKAVSGHSPLLLEIGSNDGTLLRAAQNLGAVAIGVEPGAELAERSQAAGILTYTTFFDHEAAMTVLRDYGAVDGWVATNVLAHVDDLLGTLSHLRTVSHEKTIGVVEVQYLGALLEHGLFDMIYHEHLDYHGARSLASALARQGWNVTRIEEIPTHGGSLRFWVRRGGHYEVGSSSPIYVAEGERVFLAEWAQLRTKLNNETERLADALAPYARVLCYGAPAKLTTLMYGTGLHEVGRLFLGVIDDAPSKQHKFTPGMGLPILSPTVLRDDEFCPGAVLISAWNYAAGIKQKLVDAGLGDVPTIVPFEAK